MVDTEIGATHVVTAGAGEPLVLVPGTNFAAAAWLELVDDLAAMHLVHAIDLPGQPGLSAPPAASTTVRPTDAGWRR